ncbi:hypothetical protein J4E82_009263 [Alternaria postmessia]|uniref:uncharacterized protein n=1 Tax=Alternaria postmessia TaxID=1187938 RepID=UPI002224EF36|nr:uncharacterized protein J4E82_009263 [Alternaria postmessia]KAI5372039.1 hypothetical protein J4E82_009263 [Alternaria postmessia]
MAKKKPSGNTGSNKDGNDAKPGKKIGNTGKAEAEHERISQFVLVTRKRRDTWDVLRKRLESHQAAQKKETNIEQDHYNYYTLEADHAAKVQVYKDALSQDKSGKKEPTKSAKKARDLAEKAYKKARRNNRFDRVKRRAEHDSMMTAQAELEDWLYYQDISKRRRRLRLLDPEQRKVAEKEKFDRRIGYKLETSGNDEGHFDWVHSLLEMYDSRDIGGKDYKQGRHDHLGNNVEGRQEGITLPVVGPGELHLWTPNYRRQLVGLRPSRLSDDLSDDDDSNDNDSNDNDDDDDARQDVEPHHFELDKAAIEEKRAAIEKQFDTETQELEFNTHEARRRHEVARYKDNRPNTSGDRVINTSNGVVVENRWGQIRTEQGLFISAKESSWDWRTSYDCLGPVMSGWFPETSAIRDEAPEELIDPDDDLDYIVDDGDDGDDSESSAAQIPAKHVREKVPNAGDETAKQHGTISEPLAEAPNGGEPANDKADSAQPTDESWKKIKAKIDYPYPAREFHTGKKPSRLIIRKWFTTEWAEETTGRRERHSYHLRLHSSPVHSPPRSPVDEKIPSASIPKGFAETENRPIALEPRSRRECPSNPERCRAFWTHSSNECWIPYPEQPKRPKDPIEWPIQEMDAPKGIDEGGPDGYVPAIGMSVYSSRLYDHYGLLYPNTSLDKDWQRPQWPRIGVRVPYEPMTIEDLRLQGGDRDKTNIDLTSSHTREARPGKGARDEHMGTEVYNELSDAPTSMVVAGNKRRELGTILAKDADRRAFYEVRSMAVPIIKTPQLPWASSNDGLAIERVSREDNADDDGGESDNEGDLFFRSYEDECFPNGRNAPSVSPVTGEESEDLETAVEDVIPANVAPAVVVSGEDNRAGEAQDL